MNIIVDLGLVTHSGADNIRGILREQCLNIWQRYYAILRSLKKELNSNVFINHNPEVLITKKPSIIQYFIKKSVHRSA